MNISIDRLPKCLATLRVNISPEKVAEQRSKTIHKLTKTVRVPGYRPGKTPAKVVEQRFSKEIQAEVLESLIEQAFQQALETEDLRVLDFGRIEDGEFTSGGGYTFSTTLTLSPEITLPEYKGVAVSVPSEKVPAEEVDKALEELAKRYADFVDVTDRPAETGDIAVIDYSTTLDGAPVDEALGKPAGPLSGKTDHWVQLGEEFFLPGFADAAVGMSPGESRDISITLPADYPLPELAEKTVVLNTTLKQLKVTVPAEINDELANRIAPGKSVESLRSMIWDRLKEQREQQVSDIKVARILSHLNENTDFEIPEEIVNEEAQSEADSLVDQAMQSGMTEDQIQQNQQEIIETAGQRAFTNVRTNFILRKIAETEELVVTDNELVNHLAQVAVNRGVKPKKLIQDLHKARRLEGVRRSMLAGKTIDFLLEHAIVTTEETPAEEETGTASE